nr:PREDICTED: dimethylaniline monooxygenase [N-oxide-forming] 2 [Anolis carolinensis]|eukprot:XP_016854170.1 PREDICTED: dimethylaniline monooxygenase [N-oxide-forming] 2 [Anolis carolinensis]
MKYIRFWGLGFILNRDSCIEKAFFLTPETMVLKVAIIGAGVSGLASIKCCLSEGLEPTCFEKSDGIGGLWQFTEIPERGRNTVYRSVITNTSKEMTCFSDFPFPEDCPNYLHHSVLLKYLRAYAEHFQLLDHIQFKTTVYSIRKHPDFASTGQWVVHTETDGQQASAIFDAVMVCSGSYAEPRLPLDSFPGIEKFKGRYLHSWEYRDQKEFEGKSVLVIGAGNTGGDIASEICRTAAKVFLSIRNGTWVLSRVAVSGWPSDMIFGSRLMTYFQWILPGWIVRRMKAKIFNRWFNHENYGLVPVQRYCHYYGLNYMYYKALFTIAKVCMVSIAIPPSDVFLSIRNGTWVLSRVAVSGWPSDMIFGSRLMTYFQWILPGWIVRRMKAKIFNRWFNHENYGLVPVQSSWTPVIVNDELPCCILSGAIVVKPNVTEFTETSVIFKDGTRENNIDVIIFATGYSASFPFLEETIQNICDNSVSLYKRIFPPHLEKPTLAIIGFIAINGSIPPVAELQARWVTRVFNGLCKIPPANRMMGEVAKRKKALIKIGFPMEKDSAKASFVAYMDEIAACIGVKPNLLLLFLLDPQLALKILCGPCTPYQFRLTGPGKWEQARSAILTEWDRVLKPLKTRVVNNPRHSTASFWFLALGFSFLGASLVILKCSSRS